MIGLVGIKMGMTQVFDENGEVVPVTVVRVDPHTVVNCKTEEKEGYNAVVLGTGSIKKERASRPYSGQFKGDLEVTRHLFEVQNFEKDVKVGDVLGVDLFNDTFFVDITGTSKGKGTQGVMKRWGFSGGRATHGSKFHRENGSTGMAAWPSRVLKGTKMSGQMGNERVTVQNLRVVKVDPEKQLVLVKGAVPGRRNSMVLLRNARKKSGVNYG